MSRVGQAVRVREIRAMTTGNGRLMRAFRVGRWFFVLPWLCTMDDGCAAVESMKRWAVAAAPISSALAFSLPAAAPDPHTP